MSLGGVRVAPGSPPGCARALAVTAAPSSPCTQAQPSRMSADLQLHAARQQPLEAAVGEVPRAAGEAPRPPRRRPLRRAPAGAPVLPGCTSGAPRSTSACSAARRMPVRRTRGRPWCRRTRTAAPVGSAARRSSAACLCRHCLAAPAGLHRLGRAGAHAGAAAEALLGVVDDGAIARSTRSGTSTGRLGSWRAIRRRAAPSAPRRLPSGARATDRHRRSPRGCGRRTGRPWRSGRSPRTAPRGGRSRSRMPPRAVKHAGGQPLAGSRLPRSVSGIGRAPAPGGGAQRASATRGPSRAPLR